MSCFCTPYQRYLCRHCEVSHSETTIPPSLGFGQRTEIFVRLHARDGLATEKRIMRMFPMVGVPVRTSMIYDRCGLSCPWPPFLFSPPASGERIGIPHRWPRARLSVRHGRHRTVGGPYASDTRETPVRGTYSLLFPPCSPPPRRDVPADHGGRRRPSRTSVRRTLHRRVTALFLLFL